MVKADRSHLHHIMLVVVKGDVKVTVLLIAALQLIFTLLGIFFAVNEVGQEITLPLFLACLVVFYWVSEKMYQEVKPSLIVDSTTDK